MIVVEFFQNTHGVYTASILFGLAVGVLTADTVLPVVRRSPSLAVMVVVAGFVVYLISVSGVAPYAGPLFVLAGIVANVFCTAHSLRGNELFRDLNLGTRVLIAIKGPRAWRGVGQADNHV